jgi:hypothetical protein
MVTNPAAAKPVTQDSLTRLWILKADVAFIQYSSLLPSISVYTNRSRSEDFCSSAAFSGRDCLEEVKCSAAQATSA